MTDDRDRDEPCCDWTTEAALAQIHERITDPANAEPTEQYKRLVDKLHQTHQIHLGPIDPATGRSLLLIAAHLPPEDTTAQIVALLGYLACSGAWPRDQQPAAPSPTDVADLLTGVDSLIDQPPDAPDDLDERERAFVAKARNMGARVLFQWSMAECVASIREGVRRAAATDDEFKDHAQHASYLATRYRDDIDITDRTDPGETLLWAVSIAMTMRADGVPTGNIMNMLYMLGYELHTGRSALSETP